MRANDTFSLSVPLSTPRRTYIAFDTPDAGGVVSAMKQEGVIMGTCGTSSIRLRPMLIFEEKHGKLHPSSRSY